jgi:single-strand DNA-binding protein
MSSYLNEINLIGRVGKEVNTSKTSSDGKTIVSFSLATSESWSDKVSGERKERTDWHRVVIYNAKLAEIAQNYLKSGDLVFVSGKIRYEQWQDAESKTHYKTSVILDMVNSKLIFLGSKPGNSSHSEDSNTRGSASKDANPSTSSDEDFPF